MTEAIQEKIIENLIVRVCENRSAMGAVAAQVCW
jgi:hypothetical protein